MVAKEEALKKREAELTSAKVSISIKLLKKLKKLNFDVS